MDDRFLKEKIGVILRARMAPEEDTSDLAHKALERLLAKTGISAGSIQALIVVTQNPDNNIPHISAILHGKAGMAESCAAFDISLGCSGYVYGLSVLKALMHANGWTRGVLVTADPYSKIIDPDDRNSALLFGDAATATLLDDNPLWCIDNFNFGTRGQSFSAIRTDAGKFVMDGRAVFNFAATEIPIHIMDTLDKAGLAPEQVDCYILHQGSRFIVKTIADRLQQGLGKFPINIEQYGNTVSSSIPLIMEDELQKPSNDAVLLCGFGVGLSWASCVCKKLEKTIK